MSTSPPFTRVNITMRPSPFYLTFAQVVSVSARRIGAEPSGLSTHFDAPPLENANLAIFATLLVATLIQLGLAVVSLFRAGAHRTSAFGTSAALLFADISYALGILSIVSTFTTDYRGQPGFTIDHYVSLQVATVLFANWVDPLMLTTIFLVLRNRYVTYNTPKSGEKSKNPILLHAFTISHGLFALLLVVIAIAANAITGKYLKNVMTDPVYAVDSTLYKTYDSLFYAFTAFYSLATIIILAFAIVVKMSVKSDKITILTLIVIVPSLILRALSRVIIDILNVQLPLLGESLIGLDLASTILFGGFYLIVTSMLVLFLMNPKMWERAEILQPQYASPYANPGLQQHYQGGVQPPAQFPGQWGFTGQPQPTFVQPPGGFAPQGVTYWPNMQPQVSSPIGSGKTPQEVQP